MNRSSFNLGIDLLAFLTLLVILGSGYVLWMALPPGLHHSHEFWGLPPRFWISSHLYAGCLLTALMFVHVVLHREWIATMIVRRPGAIAAWMIPAVLVLAGGLFPLAAYREARQSDPPGDPASNGDVGFDPDILPILKRACSRCHGGERTFGDFNIDRRDDFFLPRSNGTVPLVVPGDARASELYLLISGKGSARANQRVHTLSSDKVRMIERWIEQGAEWPGD